MSNKQKHQGVLIGCFLWNIALCFVSTQISITINVLPFAIHSKAIEHYVTSICTAPSLGLAKKGTKDANQAKESEGPELLFSLGF